MFKTDFYFRQQKLSLNQWSCYHATKDYSWLDRTGHPRIFILFYFSVVYLTHKQWGYPRKSYKMQQPHAQSGWALLPKRLRENLKHKIRTLDHHVHQPCPWRTTSYCRSQRPEAVFFLSLFGTRIFCTTFNCFQIGSLCCSFWSVPLYGGFVNSGCSTVWQSGLAFKTS